MTTRSLVASAVLGTVLLGSCAYVYSNGAVRVTVREKKPGGSHVWVMAPGLLLPIGARLVSRKMLEQQSEELKSWLPVANALSQELQKCPDTLLVQVESPQEHVRIAKLGNSLVVDVDDQEATVHVSVPLKAAVAALERLEAENSHL